MTIKIIIITLFVVFNLTSLTNAACPESKETRSGDIRIYQESWKTDWWFYKSIGTEIRAQKLTKETHWWCLWLCSTEEWVDIKATRLRLEADFFATYSPSPILVGTAISDQMGVSELKLEIWSIFFGSLKLTNAGFQYKPGSAPNLNIDGIQSIGTGNAVLNNQQLNHNRVCTGAGKQP